MSPDHRPLDRFDRSAARPSVARASAEAPYPQAILDLLAADPARPVFEHDGRTVTAAEMLDLVARISTGLRRAGIGPADGVAMAVGVSPEAFAAMIAAYVVGARVAGVRPGLTPGQLTHLLGQGHAAVVVDPSTATPGLRAAAGDLPLLAVGSVDGLVDLTATRAEEAMPTPAGRPDDVARIVYTSGSTGNPKGCLQTYAALGAAWAAHPDRWPPAIRDLAARLDRYLVFGTLSSLVMMEYATLTLAAGGTLVAADPAREPEPFFPGALARFGATASVITVPRLTRMVAVQRTDPVDLRTLRALLVSGSPLSPDRLAEAISVLGPVIFHGYGQTETGMISMVTPAELVATPAVSRSVGRPPAVVDVQVRDAQGRPVPVGVPGELFVRTPAQASGYLDDPIETAEVFVDGWVRTRDLARLDADGYLYLLGRTRDVIIVNANLQYAGPIERVLAEHPDVVEAYVVGAPDEETGEAVHAFVVAADPGRPPDPDALRDLVEERLGVLSRPKTVTVIDAVPIAPSGKPDKRSLAARHGLSPVAP